MNFNELDKKIEELINEVTIEELIRFITMGKDYDGDKAEEADKLWLLLTFRQVSLMNAIVTSDEFYKIYAEYFGDKEED